jgi:hypothetical protein
VGLPKNVAPKKHLRAKTVVAPTSSYGRKDSTEIGDSSMLSGMVLVKQWLKNEGFKEAKLLNDDVVVSLLDRNMTFVDRRKMTPSFGGSSIPSTDAYTETESKVVGGLGKF